ncbi:transcriptional regulator, GntR family with aminotransferase domain [Catenulispora acidiphila DSM 44928]|uniref:Transcriptional regulator, GntR family with aminotransferase domain n=1 Tax=Catenulispora acidiphila (strain DSM 44928 / JCM 14897 / NBRC 102108 / NRRL B-24433 / ID139908) TaxID=479433 RepID=C7Q3U2_CATAD|nr:PLP-dependent aminotransferase family protein [Catenulispora acidiphila]ACU77700.1 transcriptional regulator, GntR family with aminotransferase domain [Catenulispora acidiphila DSM 44928]
MAKAWTGSRLDLHLDLQLDLQRDLSAAGPAKRRAALESALREAIRDGSLRPGVPLPSSRGLAEQLGLSRGTVTSAYGQLVDEGFLTSRPGSGTAVADVRDPKPPAASPHRFAAVRPEHDLRPGSPDLAAFPLRGWTAATRRVLAAARPELFGVGDPQGRFELRAALADYLGRTRGVQTSADRVVITSGYHQSVQLIARVLRSRGARTVAWEEPGHAIFRDLVAGAGMDVRPLPVDEGGAVVEALSDEGAAFLTPAHQYPTGVPLEPSRRRAVVEWARRTEALVIEDDYDSEFRYDRRPVGAMQPVATCEVVYCGSVSKTLGPGLCLGWLALPSRLVESFVRAKLETEPFSEGIGQAVLADFVASHAYDRHVRAARLRYGKRRERLVALLEEFPSLSVQGVPAGLHVLVTLPSEGPGESEIRAEGEARGLAVRGLAELYQNTEAARQGLLIGYAAATERAYPAALEALAGTLRAVGF